LMKGGKSAKGEVERVSQTVNSEKEVRGNKDADKNGGALHNPEIGGQGKVGIKWED